MARSIAPEIHKSAFLEQTNKYVTKMSEREYLTKGDPELTIPAFTDRVSDAAYPEALSGKVIQCVDIVVFDPATERVLIGRRNQEPHSGDWVIGGAMKAGQTVVEAARKNLVKLVIINSSGAAALSHLPSTRMAKKLFLATWPLP